MSNQPRIYLGRIDGKLWLAGPTDQTVPNDYDSERGILSSADRWKSIFHLPRIEYLGQETDFQVYQAVREGVDFEFGPRKRVGNGESIRTAQPLSQDQRTIQATEQNNQTNMVNKLPILLPEEITSIQQLAEQMTAFPGVWNIHTLTRAVEKLNHDAASEVMIKLSASENEILRRYYGK